MVVRSLDVGLRPMGCVAIHNQEMAMIICHQDIRKPSMVLSSSHPAIGRCLNSNSRWNVQLFLILSPRIPLHFLKMMTAGSFAPAAVAASATVKPFFSALVVFDPNGPAASHIVGPGARHIKAAHGQIHVDDV